MKPDSLGKTVRTYTVKTHGMALEYSLIRSKIKTGGRFSYAIFLDQSAGGEHETVFCTDVTREKRRAEEMFSLISEGKVTACTFFDVLEDMI